MVNDKILMKFSLVSFFILFILFFYLEINYTLSSIELDSISKKHLEKKISIKGFPIKQKLINKNLFFEIYLNNKSIKGIIFEINKKLNSSIKYEFTGKIVLYDNKLEIIVDEVSKS